MIIRHAREGGHPGRWIPACAGMTVLLMSFSFLWAAVVPGTFQADGPRTKKAIALTFDDGPGLFTERVLELLDKHKVKATFFMNGDQVRLRPQLAREVAKRVHEVGDHTWSHMNFYAFEKKNGVEKTREKAREEIRKSKIEIEKTCGVKATILRMPNGYQRPWMKAVAKEFGYALVNWTFGEDWLKMPEEKMTAEYLAQVRPGAIFLFHDGGKGREKTLNIVPKLIEKAREKGLAVVTVSGLLD